MKSWVDTRKVSVNTVNGVVYVSGSIIFKLPDQRRIEEEGPFLMAKIEERIKGIEGVKDIKFSLFNWTKLGKKWIYRPKKEED